MSPPSVVPVSPVHYDPYLATIFQSIDRLLTLLYSNYEILWFSFCSNFVKHIIAVFCFILNEKGQLADMLKGICYRIVKRESFLKISH